MSWRIKFTHFWSFLKYLALIVAYTRVFGVGKLCEEAGSVTLVWVLYQRLKFISATVRWYVFLPVEFACQFNQRLFRNWYLGASNKDNIYPMCTLLKVSTMVYYYFCCWKNVNKYVNQKNTFPICWRVIDWLLLSLQFSIVAPFVVAQFNFPIWSFINWTL